jgi:hypothetical protein
MISSLFLKNPLDTEKYTANIPACQMKTGSVVITTPTRKYQKRRHSPAWSMTFFIYLIARSNNGLKIVFIIHPLPTLSLKGEGDIQKVNLPSAPDNRSPLDNALQ